ncbi:MAG: hypothetical protein HRT73_11130 [Flavobacteriales bacterium]|nr:hypothetical protein [Flavobacteriales bacterium]
MILLTRNTTKVKSIAIILSLLLIGLNGFGQDIVKIYYPPDSINLFEEYEVFPNTTIKNGYHKFYLENGQIVEHREYHNDKLWNVINIYDSTGGVISNKGTLKDGNGTTNNYFEGTLMATCSYKDGILHGDYTKYYENGTIMERVNYYKGERCGTWHKYSKNDGEIIETGYQMIECNNGLPNPKNNHFNRIEEVTDYYVKKELWEVSVESDTSSYPCSSDVFSNKNDIHYIIYGCGDASISRSEDLYYIDEEYLLVKENTYYYNAPPTFTKEVALREGVTGGWFDPSKTKIDSTVSYIFKGKIIKLIDKNGKELSDVDSLFITKYQQIYNEIKRILNLHPDTYNPILFIKTQE